MRIHRIPHTPTSPLHHLYTMQCPYAIIPTAPFLHLAESIRHHPHAPSLHCTESISQHPHCAIITIQSLHVIIPTTPSLQHAESLFHHPHCVILHHAESTIHHPHCAIFTTSRAHSPSYPMRHHNIYPAEPTCHAIIPTAPYLHTHHPESTCHYNDYSPRIVLCFDAPGVFIRGGLPLV
jgi:hypothetical protein